MKMGILPTVKDLFSPLSIKPPPRTEIQGVPWGPWSPSKYFSSCHSNLHSLSFLYFIISDRRDISLVRKSVRDFPRQKDFYGLWMDFSWKQKDFCQKCTKFFRSEMPLGQIGTPCSYVGHISFNCYLSLVLEALWGYLS